MPNEPTRRANPLLPAARFSLLATRYFLETKQIRELDDQRTFENIVATDTAPLIVDDEEIAQRVMEESESDVGRDSVRRGVVLDEVFEKDLG